MNLNANCDFENFGEGEKVMNGPVNPVVATEIRKPEPEKVPEISLQRKPTPSPVQNLPSIRADEKGVLVGSTIEEQFRLATAYYKSRMLPAHYDSPEKVLTAMQLCFELGLKPLTGMRQIAVINGVPCLYGDLPLAVVRASGKLERIKEFFIDKEYKEVCRRNKNLEAEVIGAVCILKRFGKPEEEKVYTVADAKQAKLWGTKVWAVHPKRMLQMRVRNWNLKDNFSDILNGVGIAEYDFNVSPENAEREVQCEVEPSVQSVNEMFGKKEETSVDSESTNY